VIFQSPQGKEWSF